MKQGKEEGCREGASSANQSTHPFRLKILLVYYFYSKFSAGGSLKGQFDFTTHSSETDIQCILVLEALFQYTGNDITVMKTVSWHVHTNQH